METHRDLAKNAPPPNRSFYSSKLPCCPPACRQLPHAPENPAAVLSRSEKRAIDLSWAKPFDGNSPLIRYILEVSENSESKSRSAFDVVAFGMAGRDLWDRFLCSFDVLFCFFSPP